MNNIEQIIADKIVGNQLDDPQEEYLQQWLNQNSKNRETYDRICRGESTSLILKQDSSNFGDKMSSLVMSKIRRRREIKRQIFKVAISSSAAIILISFYFIFAAQDTQTNLVGTANFGNNVTVGNSTQTESRNIVLITSQGEEVFLDKTVKIDSVINNINENGSEKNGVVAFNTIIVPNKMEYELELPDGTKVWLNSNSKLVFPSQFSDSLRMVELVGEAFFDVTKDKTKPFIVKTKTLNTKVLGTKFMITSYDNSNTEVSLVEGSVNVSSTVTKQNTTLKPGKGVSYNSQNSKYDVIDVNIDNVLNRKNGLFLFDNTTLEEMTEIMKNWYGVEFKFGDESVKKEIFYLKSIKYENIEDLLLLLKDTQKITYTIDNNIVTIKSFVPMK